MKKEESFHLVVALLLVVFLAVFVSARADWAVSGIAVNGSEDTVLIYNFTNNITNTSWTEGLSFSILNISSNPSLGYGSNPSNYTWISLNPSTGILTINSTFNNQSSRFTMFINAINGSGSGGTEPFVFNITPVNDAPTFVNLANQSFNMSTLFSYIVNVTDEENDTAFKLNLTFVSCNVAQWSTRNCSTDSGRALFNISDSSVFTFNNQTGQINMNFTPSRNDVGSYIMSFNITDSGNTNLPFNATYTQYVNFTVLVVNSQPYFRYVCDNERYATENTNFLCFVNASDIDETNSITFGSYVNTTRAWFKFNSTNTNTVTISPVNASTQFNATALINFTADDSMVGNWTVNITINDTGNPLGYNSTTFYFYVNNTPDNTLIQNISPIQAYTSENYSNNFISAYDDDLLIPDKSVFNEVLTFYTNDSRVYVTTNNTIANRTIGKIMFNGSSFTAGTYFVNVTVNSTNNLNTNSSLLIIVIGSNTAPQWNSGIDVNITMNETAQFFYNFTRNVTDSEGTALNFTHINFTLFPGFFINLTTGILNFTPTDADVGKHHVLVNVTDGISQVSQSFTFTVNNINDTPSIVEPLTKYDVASTNFSISSSSNITTAEDNRTIFKLSILDGDFNITQRDFYNESLNISMNISGPNTNLFSFVTEFVPSPPGAGQHFSTQADYVATFTPNKSDVGNYNITLTVRDSSNLTDTLQFNITIIEINHNPTITQESNKTTSVNRTLSFNLNGTDIENGNDSTGNLTYIYQLLSDGNTTDFINNNQAKFNTTSGFFNVTFNDTQSGSYHINFTINDTSTRNFSMDFWIFVYDVPRIIYPSVGTIINVTENVTSILSFNATHTVGDNLTFAFYINSTLRYTLNYSANIFTNWTFTPNFTDETYGNYSNLTLFVTNPTFADLNVTQSWSVNISHTNAPVSFNGSIANQQKNYDQTATVNLEDYFADIDSSDTHYNQSLNFTIISNMSSNSTITVSYSNGSIANNTLVVTFSASATALETFNISASDGQYNFTSNSFTIEFTTPSTTPESGSSGSASSGGGGSAPRPVALNILVPGPFTAKKQDKLIVPVTVSNDGTIGLRDIVLRNIVAKNGLLRDDLIASFDRSFIETLNPGDEENLTLIVDVDTTESGLYEVTLNGTSGSPKYTDIAKLYINVEEGDAVSERISFTEEFIAQNPQCIEINELLDQARELYSQGNLEEAETKAEDALEACKKAISQSARAQQRKQAYNFVLDNAGVIALGAIALGIVYYWFRRFQLRRTVIYGEEEPQVIQ